MSIFQIQQEIGVCSILSYCILSFLLLEVSKYDLALPSEYPDNIRIEFHRAGENNKCHPFPLNVDLQCFSP